MNTALAKPVKDVLPIAQESRLELDKDMVKGAKNNIPKEQTNTAGGVSTAGNSVSAQEHDSPVATTKKDVMQTHTPGSGKQVQPDCILCHIPYIPSSMPYNVHMKKCAVCK